MNSPGIHACVALRLARAALCLTLCAIAAALPAQQPASSQKADSVLILKKDHLLELLAAGKVIRTYKVALGQGGLAPKQREGDGRTPEGHYVIDARSADSHYHKALHISYPNAEDRKRAASLGVAPGGAIMIHGLPNGKGYIGAAHRLYDWTLGCIAVTDDEIDEIWTLVPVGTPVEIRP
jgi:murein L,D-transpeptidase YafK